MRILLSLILISVFTCLFSCNSSDDEVRTTPKIELDVKSARLVEADNAFGFELFQKIRAASPEENIMISPLSVSLALSMAYNGADSDTKTEMEQTMKLNELTPEQINQSYKILVTALQSLDEKVVFEIANAIYYANGFPVKQSFLDINSSYYDAEVEDLDFSKQQEAVEIINGWVSEKTHEKIEKIIESLSPNAKLVLLNAIYFYGNWTTEFKEDGTHMDRFYKNDGTQPEVAMMNKEDKMEYLTNDLFSAVKLPYGNGQYNMVVMLPAQGETSQDIIDELNTENWKSWAGDFGFKDHVVVTMPRFKFGFEAQLKDMLKALGMVKAFSDSDADFSNISEQYLYISKVVHKTYIDVNESGTEAAAVTAIVFETTSAGPGPEKIHFTVNRPFVFAITEKDTEAILFIGEVQHPEYEEQTD